MRIDKFAAEQTGISRSDAKELIKRRKITVNGTPVTSADMHVDPEKDEIIIGGKSILYRQYMYIMLNKPAGVVCATRDELSETVLELIPPELPPKGAFPCGTAGQGHRRLCFHNRRRRPCTQDALAQEPR